MRVETIKYNFCPRIKNKILNYIKGLKIYLNKKCATKKKNSCLIRIINTRKLINENKNFDQSNFD